MNMSRSLPGNDLESITADFPGTFSLRSNTRKENP